MNMKFTSPRATFEETLAFANAVREAGGGNPLDALMPAVPSNPSQCLIAKNLNFNCRVAGLEAEDLYGNAIPAEFESESAWVMLFGTNQALRDTVANALDLPMVDSYQEEWNDNTGDYDRTADYAMVLPDEIGQVAADFDNWQIAVVRDFEHGGYKQSPNTTPEDIERLKEMAPYVAESVKEVNAIGLFDEQGNLLL